MNINDINLFNDSNYLNQNEYKIYKEYEIRKAIASVLMSSDIDIVKNTNKFLQWCKNNCFLLQEDDIYYNEKEKIL